MTGQDKHFLRIMREHLLHYGQIPAEDVEKLMAMARRPTRKAMQDEIEKLRAAVLLIRDMGPMTVDDQRWRIAKDALGEP